MSERRITFQCQLLDDLHSGSGTGRLKLVDDCHARDRQNRPVVWHSTLRGLLRDVADELEQLEHTLATPERICRLFGSEGREARSELSLRSLHFARKPTEADDADLPVFLLTASTSREVHSRRPLDNTLRTIEYAAAGLAADGEIRFVGDADDARFLQLCLRRLTSLGGGKSRGSGRIQLREITETALPPANSQPVPPGCRRLRLLLKNLEPLCLPTTAYPGNILDTETFLPGQTLRGAMLTAFHRHQAAPEVDIKAFADPAGVQFTNGYIVARDDECDTLNLADLDVLPLPLTAQEQKATEQQPDSGTAPWWWKSKADETVWPPQSGRERDALLLPPSSGDEPADKTVRFKRIKADDYLVSCDRRTWRRIRPARATLMRNRTPVGRQSRNWDSRRDKATGNDLTKADLFSETVLGEDQYFLADIHFASDTLANSFAAAAAVFMAGEANDRAWLRIGRGGRPVRIEHFAWLMDNTGAAAEGDSSGAAARPKKITEDSVALPSGYRLDPDDHFTVRYDKSHNGPLDGRAFTLTLTSDLIARAADLGFHTTLTAAVLVQLAGLRRDQIDRAENIHVVPRVSVSETRVVHGYNTAAGTRRIPALAIRRGSAFLILGETAPVEQLFKALADMEHEGRGLDERSEEGFGRFVLNHPVHRQSPSLPAEPAADQNVPEEPRGGRQQGTGEGQEQSPGQGSGQPAADAQSGSQLGPAGDQLRQRRAERERAVASVLELVNRPAWKKFADERHELPKDFPARSQWQALRHGAEAAGGQEQLDGLIRQLGERSQQLSGRMWACKVGNTELHQIIKQQCQQVGGFSAQRTFLSYLCRWAVILHDRRREQERGTEG